MVAEYLHGITFPAVDIRHVYHGYIHTDVPDVGSFLSVHQTISMTVAQMTIQAVCIANGDNGNNTIPGQNTFARVSHGI